MIPRRRLLLGACGASMALAGCSGVGDAWEGEIASLHVLNHRESDTEMQIVVRDDGDTVLDWIGTVEANEMTDLSDEVDRTGRFVIEAYAGDWSADLAVSSFASADDPCVNIEVILQNELVIEGWTTDRC